MKLTKKDIDVIDGYMTTVYESGGRLNREQLMALRRLRSLKRNM